MRWFNTAGPCMPEHHYMVPAPQRLVGLREHIERMGYVIVHAPRQSGKTTALIQLARELTAEGRFASLLLSVETGAWATDDPARAELDILGHWTSAVRDLPEPLRPPPWPAASVGGRVGQALADWAAACPRPIVVFLDEVDALQDDTLVAVLRQLRAGYPRRPHGFPWSIALVGLRDVRDYVVASGGSGRLGSASPFNVKVESLTLADFTRQEVGSLYAQHTEETGQTFLPEAVDRAYALSMGQPWLVNALASRLVDEVVKDRAVPICVEHVEMAKDILIRRRDTHLDSLAERLREKRVRHVIEPMLAGTTPGVIPPDDLQFLLDLGLVRLSPTGGLQIANPIYAELLPRSLESSPRAAFPSIAPSWLTEQGDIDIQHLLEAFLAFWRRHGEALLLAAPYAEVAAQLVMMAFLDRVANGGGSLDREYAIGRGRIDLHLRWRKQSFAFELKTWRTGTPDPVPEGLEQLDGYLDGLGLDSGWLVVFDQRAGLPPIRERTRAEQAVAPSGRRVTVVWG